MVKLAQLPDGTHLEFDDATPDDEMDFAVEQHLRQAQGLPEPVDPAVESQAFLQAVDTLAGIQSILGQLTQGISHLISQNSQMLEMLAITANNVQQQATTQNVQMSALADRLTGSVLGLAESVHKSNMNIAHGLGSIVGYLSAPKTITRDAKGAPIGITIDKSVIN